MCGHWLPHWMHLAFDMQIIVCNVAVAFMIGCIHHTGAITCILTRALQPNPTNASDWKAMMFSLYEEKNVALDAAVNGICRYVA